MDLEDPRSVHFYNLTGKSFSNSFQVELNALPLRQFEIKIAYRYFDVKSTYHAELMQRPLIAAHRAFANLAYALNGWKFDYTVSYNERKDCHPLPVTRLFTSVDLIRLPL